LGLFGVYTYKFLCVLFCIIWETTFFIYKVFTWKDFDLLFYPWT